MSRARRPKEGLLVQKLLLEHDLDRNGRTYAHGHMSEKGDLIVPTVTRMNVYAG